MEPKHKTGVELITEERYEQIEKHNRTLEHDSSHVDGELLFAARYAMYPIDPNTLYSCGYAGWELFEENINQKSRIEQLVIAGALIAAEIDRLQKI